MAAETKSQDSSFQESEECMMRSSGPVASWESELASIQRSLKFVMKLREEFICPICNGVVLNPQQNSCGHIFCFHCLQELLESSSSSPVCPVDKGVIIPAKVFQDNCCKREISTLEVYCTNAPACTSVVTLNQLQEHLSLCPYELLQCTNTGCKEVLQRKNLQEHLANICLHRREPCPHCTQLLHIHLIQDHIQSSCPEVEEKCPDGCFQKVLRHQLAEHRESCSKVHTDCSYQKFGCCVQGEREKVKQHEETAVGHHMLLVLKSNVHLEKQVEVLQEGAMVRKQEAQTEALTLCALQKQIQPLLQQSRNHNHIISSAQSTLSQQEDLMSSVRLGVQQLSQEMGCGREKLGQIKRSLDVLMQEVLAAEALREHIATLEENMKHHSGLLDLHSAQLSLNKQHLQELEATSYDGKLIWKIQDFKKKKEAEGQPPCLSSTPFHTARCGYKMAVKAYLNGDGEGRGTHLSLYVVLMPGDFDPLLPWPFRQTVTLSLLDQSGARNHQSLSFKPDPMNKCFQQPSAEGVNNVAVGFPCFIGLRELETPQNAVFVKDDTLFVKAKVDTAGLDPL